MFNLRLRDVFIVLFLLFSLLIYGCSSKPKEETKSAANSSVQSSILTLQAKQQTIPDKEDTKKQQTEVVGTIEQGHDEAGGNYWINGGDKKQFTLRYVWDLDEATQAQLNKLIDSKTKVTVKGTLKIFKDGSAQFDDAQPINIFK